MAIYPEAITVYVKFYYTLSTTFAYFNDCLDNIITGAYFKLFDFFYF